MIPSEGLLGRIVADALIHYFNLVGAYLICVAVIAVALYLSTAFSFGAIRIWSQTRFGFAYAALDRLADWRMERARKNAAKDLEKKRAAAANAKPVVTAQLVPKRYIAPRKRPAVPQAAAVPAPLPQAARSTGGKTGIERMFEGDRQPDAAGDARTRQLPPKRSLSPRVPIPRLTARRPCRAWPALQTAFNRAAASS